MALGGALWGTRCPGGGVASPALSMSASSKSLPLEGSSLVLFHGESRCSGVGGRKKGYGVTGEVYRGTRETR